MSLLGFTALVFFSVTGITLNHPDWFGTHAERVIQHRGVLKREWLHPVLSSPGRAEEMPPPANGDAAAVDLSTVVSKFEIVEFLRQSHPIKGAVSEFRVDDYECLILFKGPGYSADTVIDRETGRYTITETVLGVIAVINDLHKGRDTGPVWSWVIDLSALLTIFVSVTGMILIFYIRRKRWWGLITAVLGTILFAGFYLFCP